MKDLKKYLLGMIQMGYLKMKHIICSTLTSRDSSELDDSSKHANVLSRPRYFVY